MMKFIWGMLIGGFTMILLWVLYPYLNRDLWDGEVRSLFDRVATGQSEATAAPLLLASARGLSVFTDTSSTSKRWIFSGPTRLLQDHWVLAVCVEAGKV